MTRRPPNEPKVESNVPLPSAQPSRMPRPHSTRLRVLFNLKVSTKEKPGDSLRFEPTEDGKAELESFRMAARHYRLKNGVPPLQVTTRQIVDADGKLAGYRLWRIQ